MSFPAILSNQGKQERLQYSFDKKLLPTATMLKRFLISLCLIPALLCTGIHAMADDLSQGLELYRAKKYKEAIPYLERAANDGHEKAIEALDEIYEKENKTPVGSATADKFAADKAADQADDKDAAPVPEASEDSKRSFWRKVFAIIMALGIVGIWMIHRTILKRKREESQKQSDNPFGRR